MPKYDTTDPNWRVVVLTRAGHHLWRLRRKRGATANDCRDIDAALELIWQCKVEVKAELEEKRLERAKTTRAAFARIEAQSETL